MPSFGKRFMSFLMAPSDTKNRFAMARIEYPAHQRPITTASFPGRGLG
jgi:hypothetical protein